jgi:hypothetical protein
MKASIAFGGLLVVVACAAYVTIADDLRHVGEFSAVSGILLAGLALLASGLFPGLQRHLALRWTGWGILAGVLLGAMVDRTAVGLGIGVASGLLFARLLRTGSPIDRARSP